MASSVMVTQGDTLFTRMPSLAHSQLRLRASWFMAALLMAYTLPARLAVGPPAPPSRARVPQLPAAALS
jgi:hypothetical protein